MSLALKFYLEQQGIFVVLYPLPFFLSHKPG